MITYAYTIYIIYIHTRIKDHHGWFKSPLYIYIHIYIYHISYITHPFIPLGGIPSLPCRSNSPADAAALLVPPVSPTGSLGTPW